METLSFQRRPQPIRPTISCEINSYVHHRQELEEEEEDSFFELELSVPDSDPKIRGPLTTRSVSSNGVVERKPIAMMTREARMNPKCNLSQSKRKILPIESSFPRQSPSPISSFKSAQKSRASMFRKSKSSVSAGGVEKTVDLRDRGRTRSFFTLPIRWSKEIEVDPIPTRDSNMRDKKVASCTDISFPGKWKNSKLLSKELLHKYLGFVKPLYSKVSKGQASGVEVLASGGLSVSGTASSESGVPVVGLQGLAYTYRRRHLGKSKSGSASVTGILSPARKDDSLLQQKDGIEGAILHCKRSFSSSSSSSREDPINQEAQAAAPKLHESVFKFSEVAIDKIKANVNVCGDARGPTPISRTDEEGSPSNKSTKPFSTFQSLGIHIWRAVTTVRGLKPEDITVFTIFADCRKRV
ncbi:hypothetical protein SAY86_023438 [Trapa natans]|uniref:Membrane-associated kinase regulator 5 n=1 Tax=Trapa natans TaxID=22666 RepID=A0AAN7LPY7_TRANT|nr:hypothetical protein SAY86_023438 [Trapa natans]